MNEFKFKLGLTESLHRIPDNEPMGFMKSEQWQHLYRHGSEEEQKQFIKWCYEKHGIKERMREEIETNW